jgi:hypothetical protein
MKFEKSLSKSVKKHFKKHLRVDGWEGEGGLVGLTDFVVA